MVQVINPKLGMSHKTPKVLLASLPSAALFQSVTCYEISDYGGNLAVAVNGAWRFEYPFRTTWAGRPAVGLVPTGTEIVVSDYGYQKWVSDGTYWRPAQGSALIAQKHGTATAPVAVLSATTAGVFTLPGGKIAIPAGMITPHSRLAGMALMKKVGGTASAYFGIRFGTTGTSADSLVGGITSYIYHGSEVSVNTSARIGDIALNSFTSMITIGDGVTAAVTGTSVLQSANLDHSAGQFVSFVVTSGNVADVYNLLGYTVTLEA